MPYLTIDFVSSKISNVEFIESIIGKDVYCLMYMFDDDYLKHVYMEKHLIVM